MRALCNQVGSYCPQGQNFRLTTEVKEKSTEKLRSHPHEFCGCDVSEAVRTDGLKVIFEGVWGMLSPFWDRTGGASLL